MKFRVSKKMKTKVASLGFTREDRENIPAEIADNLDVKDGATDQEVDAAIDMAIEAAIPMLKVAQSIKNRAINESKKIVEPQDKIGKVMFHEPYEISDPITGKSYISSEFGALIDEKPIQGFQRGQLNMRLWI